VSCDGSLPTPTCAESPFAQKPGVTCFCHDVLHPVRWRYPSFIAHTGSCARPNSSRRLRFNYYHRSLSRHGVIASPCWKMALPDPATAGQSLRRCLDPYPAVSFWCTCSLLPRRQRPHVRRHTFGTLKMPPIMQLQPGIYSRGCSHSLMFRLPSRLGGTRPPGCTHRSCLRAIGQPGRLHHT
jgi:hypothetical protein